MRFSGCGYFSTSWFCRAWFLLRLDFTWKNCFQHFD
ncbi:Uncharacterized protein APZ42_011890 [Daphnia magna]|uniref:Uncharacterized protein n=1 Tax=Daphnia magna TaxID=35525 RepID=A0A162SEL0_9CRUS|nr:Uncharacterized protein APZ42_011890 [Daphnia magna]